MRDGRACVLVASGALVTLQVLRRTPLSDWPGWAQIAIALALTGTGVAVGPFQQRGGGLWEALHPAPLVQWVGKIDVVQVDLTRCGGFTEGMKIASLAA